MKILIKIHWLWQLLINQYLLQKCYIAWQQIIIHMIYIGSKHFIVKCL